LKILPDGKREVTFPELWNAIGGGVAHTMEKILTMMANSADAAEDFLLVHNTTQWIIRLVDIEEYFKTHQRPSRPLSLDAEVKMLRQQNEAIRLELEAVKGGLAMAKPAPAPPSVTADAFPGRDPRIPIPGIVPGPSGVEVDISSISREKMSPEDLQAHLKKMVSGIKPEILREKPPAKKHDRSLYNSKIDQEDTAEDIVAP
jgi:hypothetical protein